jgi:hypothetical protein
VYDRESQRRIILAVIEIFFAHFDDKGHTINEKDIPGWVACFRSLMFQFLPSFKHPDFEEEREWRLVHYFDSDPTMDRRSPAPKFRTYEGNVIPFFEVSFEEAVKVSHDDAFGLAFPISETVIGPTINASLNEASVRLLLLTLNPDMDPTISHSGIPLRWL